MTYLSQRMREIREEERCRKQPKWFVGIDYGIINSERAASLLYWHKHIMPEGWPWGRGA